MKRTILFLIILSLLSLINCYSNIIDNVRKNLVEKALLSLPKKNNVDILKMFIAMSKTKEEYSLTDEESAFLIYKWITQNIIYDCSRNELGNNENPTNVYNLGMGTSKGISDLFKTMCRYMEIESDIISGYIKKTIKDSELIAIKDYIWNYIVINNTYYLIDVSSAMGACEGNEFLKYYTEFYFATNPEFFIRTHFPEENEWQLLDNIFTKEQFISMAFTTHFYYLYGFKSIYPDSNIINGLKETEIILISGTNKTKPNIIGIVLNSELDYKEINYTNYKFSNGKIELTFDLSDEDIVYFYVVIQQYIPLEERNNFTGVVLYKVNHLKKENELLKSSTKNNNSLLKELFLKRKVIKKN